MADELTPAGTTPPAVPAAPLLTPAAPIAAPVPAAATPAAPTGEDGEQPPPKPRTTVNDVPPEALKARLDAERKRGQEEAKKALLAEMGIDDPAAFKAKQEEAAKEYKRLKAEEDKRKRESMSEVERLKTDLAAANARADEAERKLRDLETTQVKQEQGQKMNATAAQYIAPEFIQYAHFNFKEYARTLPPEQLNELDERAVSKWYRKFAQENPKVAKVDEDDAAKKTPEPPPAPPKPKAPEPIRRPVTTGAPARSSVPSPTGKPADPLAGKTFRPGQHNSMTPAEVKEAAKRAGYKYPA